MIDVEPGQLESDNGFLSGVIYIWWYGSEKSCGWVANQAADPQHVFLARKRIS